MSKILKLTTLWFVFLLAGVFLNLDSSAANFLLKWDSGHFIGIAENGYKYSFQYAFFPLYPLTVFLVSKLLFIKAVWAGVLINNLSVIAALIYLYKTLQIDYSPKFSLKVILLILSFPLSFFFFLPYSESLFFLLTISSFYFAIKSKFKLACLLAGLSLLSRPLGVATVIGVFTEIFIIQKRTTKALLLPLLFFLLFSLYLKLQTGDFFYTFEAEKHWQRNLSLPLEAIGQDWKIVTSQGLSNLTLPVLAELIALMSGIYLLIISYRKVRLSFFVYFLISLVLPLLTGKLTSLPRFLLVIFPLFITLATILRGYLLKAYLIVSAIMLWFALAMFSKGYWVS